MTAEVPKRYPFRYWLAVAYGVGIPAFLKLDTTGKTHLPTFNAWTVSTILLTILCCFTTVLLTLLSREKIVPNEPKYLKTLWLCYLGVLVFASIVSPHSIVDPHGRVFELLLVFYRMAEWIVAFVVVLMIYTREPIPTRAPLLVKYITTICLVSVIIVWIVLPISPDLAYAGADDVTGAAIPRLGGTLITPNTLAMFASIAFFYLMLFRRGLPRIFGCLFMLLTIFLTYSRGVLAAFLIVITLYVFVYLSSAVIRMIGVVALGLMGMAGVVFADKITSLLSRGGTTSNISTLSERTRIWKVAFHAFDLRPWEGYGFITGPKYAIADNWTYKHWLPPHCHNDLIQALLSGGIPAAVCLFLIYVLVLWAAFKAARTSREHLFFLLTLLMLFILAQLGPIMAYQYNHLGSLFIACTLGVLNVRRIRTLPRRAPISSPTAILVGA